MTNLSFALRTCACAMAISWPFAATAQTGGNGSSSANTSVFTGQSSDGTDMVSVNVIINDTQFTAIPTDDGCGRPYYLQGFMRFSTEGADRGTISGTMLRCTNKELIAKCGQRENYPVNFDATYELIPAGPTRTLRISIHHYSKEIWNKTDCKLFRTDNGSGVLILHEVVPSWPNNSPSKMQQTIDKVKSTITNSILDPHHIFTPQ